VKFRCRKATKLFDDAVTLSRIGPRCILGQEAVTTSTERIRVQSFFPGDAVASIPIRGSHGIARAFDSSLAVESFDDLAGTNGVEVSCLRSTKVLSPDSPL
jgi:hypothetical protein